MAERLSLDFQVAYQDLLAQTSRRLRQRNQEVLLSTVAATFESRKTSAQDDFLT